MEKKRVKVWGKLRLYEASAVGIPSYPDAKYVSFSLIKALTNAGFRNELEEMGETQLNLEEKEETMETGQIESQKSISTEEVEEESTEEVEEEEEEPKTEKQPDTNDLIAKAIKDGIKEALKELETERGLVDKGKSLKEKSLGELAMDMGLFVQK